MVVMRREMASPGGGGVGGSGVVIVVAAAATTAAMPSPKNTSLDGYRRNRGPESIKQDDQDRLLMPGYSLNGRQTGRAACESRWTTSPIYICCTHRRRFLPFGATLIRRDYT